MTIDRIDSDKMSHGIGREDRVPVTYFYPSSTAVPSHNCFLRRVMEPIALADCPGLHPPGTPIAFEWSGSMASRSRHVDWLR